MYRPAALSGRLYTTQVPHRTAGEERITEILRKKFKGATYINVEDISGEDKHTVTVLEISFETSLIEP